MGIDIWQDSGYTRLEGEPGDGDGIMDAPEGSQEVAAQFTFAGEIFQPEANENNVSASLRTTQEVVPLSLRQEPRSEQSLLGLLCIGAQDVLRRLDLSCEERLVRLDALYRSFDSARRRLGGLSHGGEQEWDSGLSEPIPLSVEALSGGYFDVIA